MVKLYAIKTPGGTLIPDNYRGSEEIDAYFGCEDEAWSNARESYGDELPIHFHEYHTCETLELFTAEERDQYGRECFNSARLGVVEYEGGFFLDYDDMVKESGRVAELSKAQREKEVAK